MKKILLLFFSVFSVSAFATHERAGEITYKWRPDIALYAYEISITTYTKGSGASRVADECYVRINFGGSAGDTAIVCRSNFEPGDPTGDPFHCPPCTGNAYCGTHHMGEWSLGNPTLQSMDVKKNVYTATHTYPGLGVYIISVTDRNRNEYIVNAPDTPPLCVQDTLVISSTFGMPQFNNSVILTNPPIDKACTGRVFVHNPGAVDPDGDSLAYKLGVCFQAPGTPVQQYFIPRGVSVNPITGDFTWENPTAPLTPCSEYNFAIDIEEWKLNVYTHRRDLAGTVRRDMQVNVCKCSNTPPLISGVRDTCILANSNLTFTVTATDVENDGILAFTATGGPFNTTPAATFLTAFHPPQTPVTGVFSWTPACNQVRVQPYPVTFRALDDGAPEGIPLTAYKTFLIRVIAPGPANLSAIPVCTKMLLKWDAPSCNPPSNPLSKYRIYRKIGCDTLTPGYCETGMPASWGYTLLATIPAASAAYTDIQGLVHGNVYSYRVVASYLDGSESYVSGPVCNKLVRDVPIITNVDVASTNSTSGSMGVKWLKPLANTANLDTSVWPNKGPYKFILLGAAGYSGPLQPVATFASPYFATLNTTSYTDSPINTSSTPFTYRIEFYSDTNHCPTQNASSVFLSCSPNDNQIQISWNERVPWTNYRYDVFKFNKTGAVWDSIGSTIYRSFTDTGLVNGATYCYKVRSLGAYPDTSLPSPLVNWSQELCCSPVDKTPPCPNVLAVDSSCELSQNMLSWTNPNNSCSDDALYYVIYHKDSTDADYTVLDTVFDINTTSYLHDSLFSIAGCYAVTSVDSFGNQSFFSNVVCVDNCPYYQLPNVFTPNGDGSNDFFTPIHPYKFVQRIDIKIYNRWGTEVFHTTDPEIRWNGKSLQTKMLCSDGVYYYACIVDYIRLKGITSQVLTGYVHLLSGK